MRDKTHEYVVANAESVLLVSECPRAGGERDRVAVRPGAECPRAGYSRADAGGYEFRSET
jgi:hypothetical protein